MDSSPQTLIAGFKALREAVENGRQVLLAPSRPDADAFAALGFPATAITTLVNGHVDSQLIEPFRAADVVLVLDGTNYWRRASKVVLSALVPIAHEVKVLDLSKCWPSALRAPDMFTAFQWLSATGMSEESLSQLMQAAPLIEEAPEASISGDDGEALEERYRSKFGAMPWSERTKRQTASYEFQVAGIIPRRKTVLWYGESQSGKSFSAFDAAVHVAAGIPYQGKRTLRGGVVYCFVEKGSGAKERMDAFQQYHSLPENLPLVALTRRFDLFNDEKVVEDLAAECKALSRDWDVPLDVIVVDTHDKATPGANEIEKRDVSTILSRYEKLIELTGAAVWIIHHANASGNLRGSLILYNAIETVISISPQGHKDYGPVVDEDRRQIRRAVVKKQSEGEAGFKWDFVLRQVEVGRNEYNEPVTSCVVTPPGGSANESERKLAPNAKLILQALLKALEAKGRAAPAGIRAPSVLKVVDRQEWKAEYDRRCSEMEPDPDKRAARVRKAMERATTLFLERGYIGVETAGSDQWVWWTGKSAPGLPETEKGFGSAAIDWRDPDAGPFDTGFT